MRPLVSPSADQVGAARCPAWSVQSDTPVSAAFSRLPVDPVGYAWARPSTRQCPSASLAGSSPRTAGQSKSSSKRFGEPPASASPPRALRPNAPPGRFHDRGRCPLYVRAQLETASRSFLIGLKVVDKSSGGATRPGAARPKPSIVSRWWLYAHGRRIDHSVYCMKGVRAGSVPD